jgi:DNA repair exonuclease SbcCD ATPase subunit
MASTAPHPTVDGSNAPPPSENDSPVSDAAVSTPSRLRRNLRKALSGLLALGLIFAAGYGAGHLHAWLSLRARRQVEFEQLESERREAARAEGELRAQLARSSEQVDQLRAQRAQLQALAALNEGYRQLQGALDALDARNFGTAESRIREAEQVLERTRAEVVRVPELIGRVSELRISVASDLAPQRSALRALSQQLSSLIDAERAALDPRTKLP